MTPGLAVSIVVPVCGAAPHLKETLESLAAQDHSSLEVIIQARDLEGPALAAARAMAERYPGVFHLHVEPDDGFGDALGRGFARARGEILGWLGASDVLLPGALRRVAAEVAPDAGRHVVMGRALFLVDGIDAPAEHPAEYLGRFDHLAIWKRGFNPVPQPSVFWHREVLEGVGGFAAGAPFEVAYDFICRVGARHAIHPVDEVWSATRLHAGRAASRRAEPEILEAWIAVSRRHWGPRLSALRWRCAASLWIHGRHRHEHARHHARRAEQAAAEGRRAAAAFERLMTWIHSPPMARGRFGR